MKEEKFAKSRNGENQEKLNQITELVFILDKSGSMAGMEKDVIGGFNSMIEKQRKLDGKVFVSTVLFSTHSQVLHDREDLENITPLTEKDFFVGGGTALLDAIGGAITHISNIHKYVRQEDVPSKTVFVITTDGMENASREYTSSQVKELIGKKERKCGWEFLFLADNIDAVETGERIGIRKGRSANYSARLDTKFMFDGVSDAICEYRAMGKISDGWSKKIEERRKNKSQNGGEDNK